MTLTRVTIPAVVLILAAGLLPGRLAAQSAGDALDVFDEWNQQATRSIVAAAGNPPPVAIIHMAIVHLAIYDAVVSITGQYTSYNPKLPRSQAASVDAAVAVAAHDTLAGLFPAQRTELDARLARSLERIPASRRKIMGAAVGARAASEMLAARANDGRFAAVPYLPGTLTGMWAPAPPGFVGYVFPWIGSVRPFGIRLASQFRPAGPPAIESTRYAEDFDEVKRLGSRASTVRTAAQREIGLFWTEHTGSQTNRALSALAQARSLALGDKVRLFAMVWTTGADAIIGCWNAKSYYGFWRPTQAIRRADDDGNPATSADAGWEPLLPTAPHPEYPSGHGCATGALVESIETFFGSTDVPLVMDSTVTNTTRRFDRAGDALNEVIEARIYIGYHFRSSDVDGAALGRRTAHYVLERYFLPASR
jgi:hypothetical protein